MAAPNNKISIPFISAGAIVVGNSRIAVFLAPSRQPLGSRTATFSARTEEK